MDELAKSYQILGITPPVTEAQLKEVYRDLAKVWHPDRFQNDDRLREKAQEKLKDINGAYQVVLAAIFAGKITPEPEPASTSPPPEPDTHKEAPAPARSRRGLWTAIAAGAALMIAAGVLVFPKISHAPAVVPSAASSPSNAPASGVALNSNLDPKPAGESAQNLGAVSRDAALAEAYSILANGATDYRGHRVKAMKQVAAAAKDLGKQLNADGADGTNPEPRDLSDAHFRHAADLLRQARTSLDGTNHKIAEKHLTDAIKEINSALSVK